MINPYASLGEKELLDLLRVHNQKAFSALYDRYAASLLGVIRQIVHNDETEAISLLEKTFIEIRSQLVQFKPQEQSLFVWLLKIGRQTAIDALTERKSQRSSTLQLTASHEVIVAPTRNTTPALAQTTAAPIDPKLKELLDSVLFKNCTPEEATTTIGLPVESARQQLRLAMQQIRRAQ